MQTIQRVKTGIPGFDNLVEGGLIKNSTSLITGGTGTGKTIFCLQYLINGATKHNEPGVFLSFEEDVENLVRDASRFGWDLKKLMAANKLAVVYEEPYNIDKFSEDLEKEVQRINAKRLVIDSSSVFGLCLETVHEVRMRLFDLTRLLRKLQVTSLVTSEILEDAKGLSRFGVEEFVCDGVVSLQYLAVGTTSNRSLMIRKMRATDHSDDVHPVDITSKGIRVEAVEELYTVPKTLK